jgi:fumarate reductase subunit D
MRHPLLPFEPLIWLLFGAGIMVGTMLMTGWLLVVGVAAPLGMVPADALAFERAHALGSSLVGRVVLLAIVALPLWKGAHHTRHLVIDTFGADRDAIVAPLLYLVAAAGSLLAIVAVVRIPA